MTRARARTRAQDEIARGDVRPERIAEEGHIPLLAAMRGALRGELIDVAHRVARLECAQLYVRGHRVQREPWVEAVAVVLERLEQGDRTVVGAEKSNIREVREVSGADQ